jgi:membrane fusion protein (multidrug efflux system)
MKISSLSLPLTLLLLPLSGCGNGEAKTVIDDEQATTSAVPVQMGFPRRETIEAQYEATANLESDADAPVLAKVAGEVTELLVVEGQQVEQGQILARLDGERLKLEMLVAKARLEKARGEYQRYVDLHERGLVSKTMFDGLKYDLDALNATYELKKLNYGYSDIRAPIAGSVTSRDIMLGESLTVNQPAFRITETRKLLAYLQIPQAEFSKFSAGQRASLSVNSLPGERFDADLIRISPTIDTRNGTFRATMEVNNGDGLLAAGMFASFSVTYDEHRDALTIPLRALIQEDERTSVYVVRNQEAELRTIDTGLRSNGRVEVLGGLSEDEQVVIDGHSALKDGSKVLARLGKPTQFTG